MSSVFGLGSVGAPGDGADRLGMKRLRDATRNVRGSTIDLFDATAVVRHEAENRFWERVRLFTVAGVKHLRG